VHHENLEIGARAERIEVRVWIVRRASILQELAGPILRKVALLAGVAMFG
jgi:hypothetical protein